MRNPHAYNRRRTLQMLAAGLATAAATGQAALAAQPAPTPIEVWKDPNCGCCKDWIALMEQAGFSAKVHDSGNNAVRAQLGLPARLGSCHTALVGGYLVEGHVPPADVRCRACPLAAPAWTVPPTAAAKTRSMCCWSPGLARAATSPPAFSAPTATERADLFALTFGA